MLIDIQALQKIHDEKYNILVDISEIAVLSRVSHNSVDISALTFLIIIVYILHTISLAS